MQTRPLPRSPLCSPLAGCIGDGDDQCFGGFRRRDVNVESVASTRHLGRSRYCGRLAVSAVAAEATGPCDARWGVSARLKAALVSRVTSPSRPVR
jgi:hypothetical protein